MYLFNNNYVTLVSYLIIKEKSFLLVPSMSYSKCTFSIAIFYFFWYFQYGKLSQEVKWWQTLRSLCDDQGNYFYEILTKQLELSSSLCYATVDSWSWCWHALLVL